MTWQMIMTFISLCLIFFVTINIRHITKNPKNSLLLLVAVGCMLMWTVGQFLYLYRLTDYYVFMHSILLFGLFFFFPVQHNYLLRLVFREQIWRYASPIIFLLFDYGFAVLCWIYSLILTVNFLINSSSISIWYTIFLTKSLNINCIIALIIIKSKIILING